MFINRSRGRGITIPFGDGVRGLRIDDLELSPEDIQIMLKMRDGELRENLYIIMCAVESSEHYRHRRTNRDEVREEFKFSPIPQSSFGLPDEAYQPTGTPVWPEAVKETGYKELHVETLPDTDDDLIWKDE